MADMADYTHTIDRWDEATGENLIEQIAKDYRADLSLLHPLPDCFDLGAKCGGRVCVNQFIRSQLGDHSF
jgi:hypothetical protein